ncbi:polysaccharide biosynthesis protein [Terrimonas sp.]|uniref:oligosaccharide flippase family protein n=1 Tax=Terrimonas sp. TaxID=1914338 RepID=UPI000D51E3E0|nr:oligosaccharide flippase family protein [Terrimonas sp.]PVD51230.1 polysaccharide biosynthesis protein [Terrimonas sp.]
MAGIKQLAGQTIWYGGSTIVSRLLNYLLTPYLTLKLTGDDYGDNTLVYSLIPFLNIIFTYGLETGFFRFSQKKEQADDLNNVASISIIASTLTFTVVLFLLAGPIASLISIGKHPEYIKLAAIIIAFDSLSTIPFAKLRQEGRPIKFAIIRVSAVLVNLFVLYFLLSLSPQLAKQNPNSVFTILSNKSMSVTYVLIANVIMSGFTFMMLWKEFKSFEWKFNVALWKEVMAYSMPMLIVGLGGMVNETLDRLMLGWFRIPKFDIGTYGACYKLSILITIFIQAFRLGAEPFFFKQAAGENPQRTYARVMKFFVIVLCTMFLFVALYIDIWKHFIQNPAMWAGLKIVPVLLLANMFLGIYYNLAVWYKVTNNTKSGAIITIGGAIITIAVNFIFIPKYSYTASAWATFICYGSMMVACYIWGQKVYPVPYAWKKLVAYIIIAVLLFFIHTWLTYIWNNNIFGLIVATIILIGYLLFIIKIEKREFQKLPVIGKYIR